MPSVHRVSCLSGPSRSEVLPRVSRAFPAVRAGDSQAQIGARVDRKLSVSGAGQGQHPPWPQSLCGADHLVHPGKRSKVFEVF